jgi:hypothetical protein
MVESQLVELGVPVKPKTLSNQLGWKWRNGAHEKVTRKAPFLRFGTE